MEIVQGKYEQKNLTTIANGQIRVPVRMEMQNLAKKLLTVTAAVFVTGVDRKDGEIKVNGKVVTRAMFIDEFDGYNSEEHTDEFSEKFTPKNSESYLSVTPMVAVIQTAPAKTQRGDTDMINAVTTEHVLNIELTGLLAKEICYVGEVKGDIESKREQTSVVTWGGGFFEKFEIGETFTLDSNVEGILGTELNAVIRDITVADERFTVKGTACVTVCAVRNTEGAQSVGATLYEFDFAKTFNKKEITERDLICGSVCVANLGTKVENRTNAELVVEAELIFTGHSLVRHDITMVSDAFSCDCNLDFNQEQVTDTVAAVQSNAIIDIESNVSMPDGTPFIGKVLLSSAANVGNFNVKPAEDKVTIEGVLTVHIIYECEEHNIYSHIAEVPFSVNCKTDACTPNHNVNIAVMPLSCNVKARRGKELLVDARVGVNLMTSVSRSVKITSNIELGKVKPCGPYAITVHVAGARENLWDIAKRASIPTAEILRQNPDIENGINEGDRIVMYRKCK